MSSKFVILYIFLINACQILGHNLRYHRITNHHTHKGIHHHFHHSHQPQTRHSSLLDELNAIHLPNLPLHHKHPLKLKNNMQSINLPLKTQSDSKKFIENIAVRKLLFRLFQAIQNTFGESQFYYIMRNKKFSSAVLKIFYNISQIKLPEKLAAEFTTSHLYELLFWSNLYDLIVEQKSEQHAIKDENINLFGFSDDIIPIIEDTDDKIDFYNNLLNVKQKITENNNILNEYLILQKQTVGEHRDKNADVGFDILLDLFTSKQNQKPKKTVSMDVNTDISNKQQSIADNNILNKYFMTQTKLQNDEKFPVLAKAKPKSNQETDSYTKYFSNMEKQLQEQRENINRNIEGYTAKDNDMIPLLQKLNDNNVPVIENKEKNEGIDFNLLLDLLNNEQNEPQIQEKSTQINSALQIIANNNELDKYLMAETQVQNYRNENVPLIEEQSPNYEVNFYSNVLNEQKQQQNQMSANMINNQPIIANDNANNLMAQAEIQNYGMQPMQKEQQVDDEIAFYINLLNSRDRKRSKEHPIS